MKLIGLLYTKAKSSPIFNGFLITTIGSGLAKLILIVCTFYCTNVLTKQEFGGFSFIRNTLNMILCICALNYVGLCTKFTAEASVYNSAKRRLIILLFFSLSLCIIGGGILFLLPDEILLTILGDASLIMYFRILGLLFPVFMIQPLLEGVFRGLKKFKLLGYLEVLSAIVFFLFVYIGIEYWGYEGAVYGMILYYVLYSIVSLIISTKVVNIIKFIHNNIFGIGKELSVLTKIILPVFFLSFVEAPINWWAQALMTKYDTLSSIATMTAVVQIRNTTILLPNYLASAFFAFAASMNAEKKYVDYFTKNDRLILYLLLLSLLFFVSFELFDEQILGLYGESYKKDTFPFFLSNIVIPFMIVGNFLKGNLTIMEHQRIMLMMSIVYSLLFISIIYLMLILHFNSVIAYFCGQIGQYVFTFLVGYYIYLKDKKLKLTL